MDVKNRLYKIQFRSPSNKSSQRATYCQLHQQRVAQHQLKCIQASLLMMNSVFEKNIKIQQIYVDLMRAKSKQVKISTQYIRLIFKILQQNHAEEDAFVPIFQKFQRQQLQKQQQSTNYINIASKQPKQLTHLINDKIRKHKRQILMKEKHSLQLKIKKNPIIQQIQCAYKRLYCRLIQAIVRKLSYYFLNRYHLQHIILFHINEITQTLVTLLSQISSLKSLHFIYTIIQQLYQENQLIQQIIHRIIVDQGHVMSMDQFFRVNGVKFQQKASIPEKSPQRQTKKIKSINVSKQLIKSLPALNTCQINQKIIKIIPSTLLLTPNIKLIQKPLIIQKQKQKQIKIPKSKLYVQKLSKDIQTKYDESLNKIDQMVAKGQIEIEIDLKANRILPNQQNQQIQSTHSLQNHNKRKSIEIQNKQRIHRKSQQKSTNKKKNSFKYFSSSFKKISNDNEQKRKNSNQQKGFETLSSQTLQQNTKQQQNISGTQKSFIMEQKQNTQPQQVKNPSDLTRINLNLNFSSQLLSIKRKQKIRIHTLINRYRKNHQQNSLIECLFSQEMNSQQIQLLQKQLLSCNTYLIKKIQQTLYNQIQQTSSNQRQQTPSKQRQISQQSQTLKQLYEQINQLQDSPIDYIFQSNAGNRINNQYNPTNMINNKQNKNRNTNQIKNKIKNKSKRRIITLDTNIDNNYSQIEKKQNSIFNQIHKNKQNTFFYYKIQGQTSEQDKNSSIHVINNIYNEYNNPLNKNYGYYNQSYYSQIKKDFQAKQKYSFLSKNGLIYRNQQQIGNNFVFLDSILETANKKYLISIQNNPIKFKKQSQDTKISGSYRQKSVNRQNSINRLRQDKQVQIKMRKNRALNKNRFRLLQSKPFLPQQNLYQPNESQPFNPSPSLYIHPISNPNPTNSTHYLAKLYEQKIMNPLKKQTFISQDSKSWVGKICSEKVSSRNTWKGTNDTISRRLQVYSTNRRVIIS